MSVNVELQTHKKQAPGLNMRACSLLAEPGFWMRSSSLLAARLQTGLPAQFMYSIEYLSEKAFLRM